MPGADADLGFGRERPRPAAVLRLENALDRIAGALVRRVERDALRADRPAGDAPRPPDARIDEVREQLDVLIARLRTAIGDDEDDVRA